MSRQARYLLVASRVPQPYATVAACRCDELPTGVERRSVDHVGMTEEDTQTFACRRVPQANRAIATRRDETTAVAVEGDGVDLFHLPVEISEEAKRVRIRKNHHAPASIPAGPPLPGWTESEWNPIPCPDLLTGCNIRNACRPSVLRVVVSHGDSSAVGTDGEGPHALARCHSALNLSGR